ncbi:13665_t:CDS:2 [Cetraspora pellucida]|uniref:13665_t:CDS:1 n=1 Tax=Cetraspora pellucida TaxID=1433469 RepID=A0A9N9IIU9_9GLOM|nr:13665_t:CDS:2 [Cetraspora pellucida]
MGFTGLPPELSLSICSELDEENLNILSIVSHDFNKLASDNEIWKQFALERWKDKQGIKKICEENRRFWSNSGTWKRVYSIVEREAQRTLWDVNDLVENSWTCTHNDNHWGTNQLVTFHPNGTYTQHHQAFFDRSYSWSIAGDGSISLNQKSYKSSRSPDWNLIIENDLLTFTSSGNESFRRKLKEFDSELIIEFGQCGNNHLR